MIKQFKNLYIRKKILSAFALVLFLISLFNYTYFPLKQKRQVTGALENKAESIVRMLATRVSLALEQGDYEFVNHLFNIIKSDTNIVYIALFDGQENQLISFNPREIVIPLKNYYSDEKTIEENGKLHTKVPIQIEEGENGNLMIGFSLQDRDVKISRIRMTGFVVSLAIFLLGILISNYLSHMITDPLKRVVKTINHVGRTGDYHHVIEKSSTDEVGMPISAFNDMSAKIQQRTLELQKSETQMSSVLNTVGEGIITIDKTSSIIMANQASLNIWGYQLEEVIGKHLHILMPEKYRTAQLAGMKRYLNNGVSTILGQQPEFEGLKKDGSTFPLEISIAETKIGENVCFTAAARDITNRKQREEQLQKLSLAVEQSPSMVMITDVLGNIEYVNPKFTQITGYSSTEIFGINASEFKGQSSKEIKRMWNTLSAGDEWCGEFHNKRKNGQHYWELASISAIKNQNDSITHFIKVAEDVTERKRAEEELQTAKETAEAANRSKSEFLANMSHEIRTPMNAIIGMSELALDTELTSEQRGYLNVVQCSSDGLLSLINDILDFSKIEAGQLELERISFDFREIVESVADIVSVRAHNKDLELLCYVQPTLPTLVVAKDKTAVHIEYGYPDFKDISVLVVDDNSTNRFILKKTLKAWGFQVQDAASGQQALALLQDDKQKFNLLILDHQMPEMDGVEVGRTVRKKPEFKDLKIIMLSSWGGLNAQLQKELHIAHSITKPVKQSKLYDILLQVLRIRTPRQKNTTQLNSVQTISSFIHNQRILLVEDNLDNQNLAKMILEKTGCQVDIANNGKEAVAATQKFHYDLILMDIQMPVMDGYKAAAAIRKLENGQKIPIIALTAHQGKSERKKCFDAGCTDYLFKPIRKQQLLSTIEQYLKSPDADKLSGIVEIIDIGTVTENYQN